MRPAATTILAIALLTACASGGSTASEATGQSAASATRSTANLITAEDIGTTNARNLLEAVRQLRPRWLRQTTTDPLESGVMVKLTNDGRNHRDGPRLETLDVFGVEWVQYFDAAAATVRFGWTHNRGVVLVKIKS